MVDTELFLSRLVGPLYDSLSQRVELTAELTEVVRRGTAAWPQLDVDAAELIVYVADRLSPDANEKVLGTLFVEDLALAAACVRGNDTALRLCEQEYASAIERALDTVGVPSAMRDEVWSRLRARMFVATPEAPPMIASFSGRGSLKKWLRVAATRLAISLMRERHREVPMPEHDLPDAADDLALGHLKRTYQTAFKEAFAKAMADLTSDQRTLLRLHLLDKLSIDDLARMHKVHRTSTARWLREAREVLANGTRTRLHAALGVPDEELDSIMNIVRSRLDLSLSRLFATDS